MQAPVWCGLASRESCHAQTQAVAVACLGLHAVVACMADLPLMVPVARFGGAHACRLSARIIEMEWVKLLSSFVCSQVLA